MTTNVQKFVFDLERDASGLGKEDVRKLQRLLTFELLRRVSDRTRVDTGRARAGNIVSVGSPSEDQPSANLRGANESVGSAAARIQAQNEAQANRALLSLPYYAVTYVSNNVNYVKYLEEGTDKIPPDAMYATSFNDIKAIAAQRGAR